MNRTVVWVSVLIILNLFWASSYTVMKLATGSLHPMAIVVWRMALAGVVMGALGVAVKHSFAVARRDMLRLCAVGALTAASHGLVLAGIRYSQAIDASLLYVIEPLWGITLATIVLKESFTQRMVVGLVLVIAGAVLLSAPAAGEAFGRWSLGGAAWGNVLIVAGLLCEGSFSVAVRPLVHRYAGVVILAYVFAASTIVLIVPTLLWAPRIMPASIGEWSRIAYLGLICGVVGYLGWIRIMRHVPVNIMHFSIFIQPVVGAAVAWLVLGETVTGGMLVAGALLMAGFSTAATGVLNRAPRVIPGDVPMIEAA